MKARKGIILAGGTGTRLFPLTKSVSKQLLPVYSKPMIYYPLSLLMLSGIRDILVITTPQDSEQFRRLLGDGGDWGVSLSYAVQPNPEGLAQAYIIGERFLDGAPVAMVLGDNIFFGHGLAEKLRNAAASERGATVFAQYVHHPQRYGVISLDSDGRPTSIEEKPVQPKSNYAVAGLYFHSPDVVERAKTLRPSARGELEITDLNRLYLDRGELNVELLGRGYAWFDAGTHRSLLEAATFVESIESRQSLMIACPEEIAYQAGWIDAEKLQELARALGDTDYARYLVRLAQD